MNKLTIIIGTGFYLSLLFTSCNKPPQSLPFAQLERVDSIVLSNEADLLAHVSEGLIGMPEQEALYGLDFRTKRPFKIAVNTGKAQFLSSKGRGPLELMQPVQMIKKNDEEFYVYDSVLDVFAHFKNDTIADKLPGIYGQEIWLRNPKGFYINNHLITAMVDPGKMNLDVMDFDNARSLAFYNMSDFKVTKKGKLSPTLDRLDAQHKFPLLAVDTLSQSIYYVFYSDYSIMKYDMQRDSAWVASSYKPEKMRLRSIPINPENIIPTKEREKKYGLDNSRTRAVAIIENYLLVVWQNYTPEFYDIEKHNKYKDFFGILYNLQNFDEMYEISLPGPLLGMYNDLLLIEENEDLDAYTIGMYALMQPG